MDLRELLGALSALAGIVGLYAKLSADARRQMDALMADVHGRISALRDDSDAKFASKETIDIRLGHVERTLQEIRDDFRRFFRTFDKGDAK